MEEQTTAYMSIVESAIDIPWKEMIEDTRKDHEMVHDIVVYCTSVYLNSHITMYDNSNMPFEIVQLKETNIEGLNHIRI